MPDQDADDRLGAVYGASGSSEIARIYDDWAEGYETEMAALGYRHPTVCLALLARHLPAGAGPVLDAGAGTGLIGEWLGILGYAPVDAVDISPGMLTVARRKGVYRNLVEADFTETPPFPDGAYAGLVCAGVFTQGHVGVEGIDPLLRLVRPGGVLAITVKDGTWRQGFAARLGERAADGTVELLDETPPYSSMPGRAGNAPSRGVAVRKL